METRVPILIFHGRNDDAVPLNDAFKLKQYLKPGDHLTILEGDGHGDFATNDQYIKELGIVHKPEALNAFNRTDYHEQKLI
jgi:pimeloyl-ACP methyl ester carboxylesterase